MASLYELYQRREKEALAANRKREQEVRGIYGNLASIYAPGGSFGAGYEAQLSRSKEQDVASGMQALVSGGMQNTTQAAGLGKKWEEDVGATARLKLEDLRMDRYAQTQRDLAGFSERIENPYPDYSQLLQASAARASAEPTYQPQSYSSPGWSSHPIMGSAAASSREAFLAPGRKRTSGFVGLKGKGGSVYGRGNPYMR